MYARRQSDAQMCIMSVWVSANAGEISLLAISVARSGFVVASSGGMLNCDLVTMLNPRFRYGRTAGRGAYAQRLALESFGVESGQTVVSAMQYFEMRSACNQQRALAVLITIMNAKSA